MAELNRRAMAWCIANDLTEAAVVYGHAAGETDTVADLLEGLALPLYFDGRLQTAEEWFGWFGEDELVQHPALAVYGAWIRVLTGRPEDAERLLALADGGDLDGPSGGWQRHDRALDRHSARAHDAGRRRTCARRRESGARSAPTGKLVDPRLAPHARCCARAARRNRS